MWKKIKSLNEKYEISKKGIIRNVETKKIIKWQKNKYGYACATVRPEKNKQINIRIHCIVAEVYLGERPKGYVINHKDGNKLNNNYKNLEYVTSSQNNKHAYDKGLKKKPVFKEKRWGEKSPNHKLKKEDVIKIIEEHYKTGNGCRKIAKKLNYPLGAVEGILSKKRIRWENIDREKIKNELKKEGKLNGKFS